jgi:hypothetical protein
VDGRGGQKLVFRYQWEREIRIASKKCNLEDFPTKCFPSILHEYAEKMFLKHPQTHPSNLPEPTSKHFLNIFHEYVGKMSKKQFNRPPFLPKTHLKMNFPSLSHPPNERPHICFHSKQLY